MSIIWRIIGAVSIILGQWSRRKITNSRKNNRKILEHLGLAKHMHSTTVLPNAWGLEAYTLRKFLRSTI